MESCVVITWLAAVNNPQACLQRVILLIWRYTSFQWSPVGRWGIIAWCQGLVGFWPEINLRSSEPEVAGMRGCWEQRREGGRDLSQLHAWMLKFILAVTRQRGDTSQPAGAGAYTYTYTYARETSTQAQAHTRNTLKYSYRPSRVGRVNFSSFQLQLWFMIHCDELNLLNWP